MNAGAGCLILENTFYKNCTHDSTISQFILGGVAYNVHVNVF